MKQQTAAIIIDTGYSVEAMKSARNILAILDVRTGSIITGFPYLTWEYNEEVLTAFAGDPYNHGSSVLGALMQRSPEMPVILIRAYTESKLIRTTFANGRIVKPGWTEAYLSAVALCKSLGMNSVANLSFGGYTHAADGSGWESYSLGSVTGPGKPGHIVVAGAGAGGGDAIHSSWRTEPGQTTEVTAYQSSTATYNFWCAADADSPQFNDWLMEVFLDDRKIGEEFGGDLIPNFWNDRKQVTFQVDGAGTVKIRTTRFWGADRRFKGLQELHAANHSTQDVIPFHCAKPHPFAEHRKPADPLRFDCWINQVQCSATFLDHQDSMTIAEPAIFPHVIAVGLNAGKYSFDQFERGAKPDLLIEGDGPISFRLPEIVAEIGDMLNEDPSLDMVAVRSRLLNVDAPEFEVVDEQTA